MMQTFPHVEDYIELLSGQDFSWIALRPKPVIKIKLARYDISIVTNMADNTVWGTALTDRQAELAVRLILKYRRQFAKFGIDVSPLESSPVYRLPLRKIDRSKTLKIIDNQMVLKFPYDEKMIQQVREFQQVSQGKVFWNSIAKTWNIAITEFNVNYIVTWGQSNGIDIDIELVKLYEKIIASEKQPYSLKLVLDLSDKKYKITNAERTLQEYIEKNCENSLIKLVDLSGVLGYEVDEILLNQLKNQFGDKFVELSMGHCKNLEPTKENLQAVFDYANITNRFPVCIYDANLAEIDLSRFNENEILLFDHNAKSSKENFSIENIKVVHARKIPNEWEYPIPLLVSTAEMMYGGRRLDWINRAEKIMFMTESSLRKKNELIF